jgi:hypothetical protein
LEGLWDGKVEGGLGKDEVRELDGWSPVARTVESRPPGNAAGLWSLSWKGLPMGNAQLAPHQGMSPALSDAAKAESVFRSMPIALVALN